MRIIRAQEQVEEDEMQGWSSACSHNYQVVGGIGRHCSQILFSSKPPCLLGRRHGAQGLIAE